MVSVVTTVSLLLFRQTLFPKMKHLRCLNQGPGKDRQDDFRFKYHPSKDDLKTRITRFCKPNYTRIMCRSTSFVKSHVVPVRFHPEPSMHHPACTDFSRTRLHSLPLTKSPEHPGTAITPWSPFLGCFRWYSERKRAGMSMVKDTGGGENRISAVTEGDHFHRVYSNPDLEIPPLINGNNTISKL